MSENKHDIKSEIADGFRVKRKPLGNGGDLRVEVYERRDDNRWCKTRFSVSAIERLCELQDNASVIVLGSGKEIFVRLGIDELEDRLYASSLPLGARIDLADVTGAKVHPIPEKPGDIAADGSIYLGVHGGRDWFVAARSANIKMAFNQAAEYARDSHDHGQVDWGVPDVGVLSKMYENRNKGAFNSTYKNTYYWSSTELSRQEKRAKQISFNDGNTIEYGMSDEVYVRCVRSVPCRG